MIDWLVMIRKLRCQQLLPEHYPEANKNSRQTSQ